MSVVGPRPLLVQYLPLYNEHQATIIFVYILDGDIFGVSPILENEFYKCIGINIDLRWVLSLMVSCRFNILYDNL